RLDIELEFRGHLIVDGDEQARPFDELEDALFVGEGLGHCTPSSAGSPKSAAPASRQKSSTSPGCCSSYMMAMTCWPGLRTSSATVTLVSMLSFSNVKNACFGCANCCVIFQPAWVSCRS